MREATALPSGPKSILTGTSSDQFQYACADVSQDSAAKLSAPSKVESAGDTLPQATAPLDTTKVKLALKTCATLTKGSLINVISATVNVTKDSVAVAQSALAVLVVSDAKPVSVLTGTRLTDATVIPYAACIPMAGQERTSFAVSLAPTASGGDALVRDIAEACLAP